MFCDVLHLIYLLKLPCRTCSVIAHSAGALLYQKIFMVAEQLVTHSFVFGDPLLGAGPRPRCRSVGTDTSHFGSRVLAWRESVQGQSGVNVSLIQG